PDRDNSSGHFLSAASPYFDLVQSLPLGFIERLNRLFPLNRYNTRFRQLAYRWERVFPFFVQRYFARTQTLVFQNPKSVD
ncbi:MAG: class I SAM-dependent methyltransferase, partial [Flavobacteriaceae bacterium]|nr:class I SAM-dependent methyltransferase [Flavobacteriaceae bacterium]